MRDYPEWRPWDCITSFFPKCIWSLLYRLPLGSHIVTQLCFLFVRSPFSSHWVCLPKCKNINFLESWSRKLFCWLKPCIIPLAEKRLAFDFHMQPHVCLSLVSLFGTVYPFIFAFWIAFLQWITIPQDLWYFFSSDLDTKFYSLMYCTAKYTMMSFSSLEDSQKNPSINSSVPLQSNILLCFSLLGGLWTLITLGYPGFLNYGT